MTATPDYGETPVDPDELDSLTTFARSELGAEPTKAEVYDFEQAILIEVRQAHIEQIIDGALRLDELLTDHFLRDLHGRLYGDIWTWAGRFRIRELNLGVAPEQIAVDLRSSLENLRWRWKNTTDWTAQDLGIAVHAETVRIHPFVDGNGRSTRLLADLVFFAAQPDDAPIEEYDWAIDKTEYIKMLREFEVTRDPKALAAFIPVRFFG
ncbi:cell filamentation protein Fic [Gulosibacter macacae]|uniref:Cell filamentation protein Fic n=1 Tax=Gulosibacter macacae TaxID=2488791 RepID=A0A3P3VVY3_9MICO|nr:Fic family protein [Gulosibacter macacae]RRJ86507.1 cell filamentation protein Fic [Gulosibacter macacae]